MSVVPIRMLSTTADSMVDTLMATAEKILKAVGCLHFMGGGMDGGECTANVGSVEIKEGFVTTSSIFYI